MTGKNNLPIPEKSEVNVHEMEGLLRISLAAETSKEHGSGNNSGNTHLTSSSALSSSSLASTALAETPRSIFVFPLSVSTGAPAGSSCPAAADGGGGGGAFRRALLRLARFGPPDGAVAGLSLPALVVAWVFTPVLIESKFRKQLREHQRASLSAPSRLPELLQMP